MNEEENFDFLQKQDIEESQIQESQLAQSKGDIIQIKGTHNQVSYITNHEEKRQLIRYPQDEKKIRRKARENLIETVENFWVKQVLEELLHNKIILPLELEERADFVKNSLEEFHKNSNKQRKILPDTGVKGIIQKLEQLIGGKTLLILGEPTGGKTTILLELASYLIQNLKRKDIDQPIPVVFDLSSWNKKQNFQDWLINQFLKKYKLSENFAHECIINQKIILLLDNLNKIDIDDRDYCIQALNKFNQEYEGIDVIVTCNLVEYTSLPTQLSFKSAIYIQRPTLREITKIPKPPSENYIKYIFIFILRKIKKLNLFISRIYTSNYILILGITSVLMVMIFRLDPSLSDICEVKKNNNTVALIFNRFVNLDKDFNFAQGRKEECFIDIQEVPGGNFSFNGSTTWEPVLSEIDSAIKRSSLLQFNINNTGSTGSIQGIKNLLDNKVSFALSSENHQDILDKDILARKNELESIEVAQDAVIIVVNRKLSEKMSNNKILKIGMEKKLLKSIYTNKEDMNWSQLGGPNVPIIPYSRKPNISGTVDWFKKNVLNNEEFSQKVQLVTENSEAFKMSEIQGHEGAIYYGSAAVILPQCEFYPLSVEGEKSYISPSKQPLAELNLCRKKSKRNQLNIEAINNKKYPFIRSLFVIYKKDNGESQKAGTAFARLLLTKQGQEIFEKNYFAKLKYE